MSTTVARPLWLRALLLLAVGLALLGWAFRTEIAAAVATWDSSTAYNHCWLVLPIAAWLGWQRRARLATLLPEPTAWPALIALGGGAAWLAAERLGIMEGRQFAALGIILCWVVAVLGLRFGRAMAGPLAYLLFLVPFGGFMVPALQQVTKWMIVLGLQLLQIPHFVDDLIIEIPAGVFLVAEACAGLRFIIASLAFGALYALVMFRSPGRRALVMLLAIIVPVMANGLRALGTVLLGHWMGSAQAAAADHLLYGWVFFALVMLLLILAGLPFRQDGVAPPPPPPARPPVPGRRWVTACLALLAGLAAPSLVAAMQRDTGAAESRLAALIAPPGCEAGAGDGEMRCPTGVLRARIIRFPTVSTWSVVVAERRRLTGQDDEATLFSVTDGDTVWRGRQGREGSSLAVSFLDGKPANDGLATRLAQARNSLLGGGAPLLIVLNWERPETEPLGAAAGLREREGLRLALATQMGSLARLGLTLSLRARSESENLTRP